MDRTTTIRASVSNVEVTLVLAILLVIIVVFIFLRNGRATLIPGVAVPASLIGTCAVMYLCGYSIDNLSLMALTISTGFVVDDAIVVMENITRHIEAGMAPMAAALKGAQEIGFTVFSISISLIAVFIPILMMAGIMGRLFREFAVTLSTAILVSMVISLTTTPMMCAYLLKHEPDKKHGRLYNLSERFFNGMLSLYRRSLSWALDHPVTILASLDLTIALNVVLVLALPKGFFPQQDTGTIFSTVRGPQDASYPVMLSAVQQIAGVIKADPAVANAIAFTNSRIQQRFHLYHPQAALGAQSLRVPGRDQPPAPKTERRNHRRPGGSQSPAGYQRRRARRRRRAVSIHHAIRQLKGARRLGPQAAEGDDEAARFPGRQFRPADRRTRPVAHL